jgi:geranylgeranyl pyrophosphate synthase
MPKDCLIGEYSLNTVNFLFPIQELMVQVEECLHSQADGHHPDLSGALDHLLSSGGKRIRPAIALLAGNMLGADKQCLVPLAAALELLHTATLVHDDLIDGALFRRGIATLNARWSPAATVLTGDYIFARAARLAAAASSLPVMKLFAETLSTIVNGEITQLFSSRGLANRDDYYNRIYAKTASMFEAACTSAALLSPVDETIVQKMHSFGYDIGMAFQIVDDILDFTGEQATLGKPVASDLRQGLITLPALYYLEVYPDDLDMKAILNGNNSEKPELDRLILSIRESGVIPKAMVEAEQFVDQGLEILLDMPDNPERHALEDLSRYIVDRRV